MKTIHISTFYRFKPLDQNMVQLGQAQLEAMAAASGLRGLILMGAEGVNATVSGTAHAIEECKRTVNAWLGVEDMNFKDSLGSKHPFLVFKIKIKNEIVTLGQPGLVPTTVKNHHLSPADWHAALSEPGVKVIDTRNRYETEIGKFRSALDLEIDEFSEFPSKLKSADIGKDERVLIYCTGGIRCEKAILHMHEEGYKNVSQLDGGILNYFKEYPEGNFDGECFVFDYRVAVDSHLEPTKRYTLCPHCGQPANQTITCPKCGRTEVLCTTCHLDGQRACSKNCAHHISIGSNSSKAHLPELKKRHRAKT